MSDSAFSLRLSPTADLRSEIENLQSQVENLPRPLVVDPFAGGGSIPLPAGIDEAGYLAALSRALAAVRGFAPAWLVVSVGMDTLAGDLWGDFALGVDSFARLGAQVAALGLPTVVVQEGGYDPERTAAAAVLFLRAIDREG